MRRLWMRLGVSLELTEAEETAIFCGDGNDAEVALLEIVNSGRAKLDGDSYIPSVCIEEFNEAYGTDYCTEDLGLDLEGAIAKWKRRKSWRCYIQTAITTLKTMFSRSKRD